MRFFFFLLLLLLLSLVYSLPSYIKRSEAVNNAYSFTKTSDLYPTEKAGIYIEVDSKTKRERPVFLDYTNDTLIDKLWCCRNFENSKRGYFGKNSNNELIMCKESIHQDIFSCQITKLPAVCKSLYVGEAPDSSLSKNSFVEFGKNQPKNKVPAITSLTENETKMASTIIQGYYEVVAKNWIDILLVSLSIGFGLCVINYVARKLIRSCQQCFGKKRESSNIYREFPGNSTPNKAPIGYTNSGSSETSCLTEEQK